MTAPAVAAPASGTAALDAYFPPGSIRTLYHPIRDLRAGRVVGHEALMRGPGGTPYETPDLAFGLARALGGLPRLDVLCLEAAFATAPPGPLFLNLHPESLGHREVRDRLVALVRQHGRRPEETVVEVVEHAVGSDSRLAEHLLSLRAAGFALAVDDLGQGAAGLRRLLELRPRFAKVDRWFVGGASRDPARRAVLAALAGLGRDLGVGIVAEGIESEDDLDAVLAAGIELGQGFLFGRPAPAAAGLGPEAVLTEIDGFASEELDALPFGVIQLAADGRVLQFNQYEENLSSRRAPDVVGRDFFGEVAPCADVQEFAGRFREGVRRGRLHASFDYRFAFVPQPRWVRVTLYLSPGTATVWVFVQDREAGAPRSEETGR